MKRYLIRAAALVVLLASASAGALGLWLAQTRVAAKDLPPLRSGDIVFQESGSSQTKAIAFASRSLYTHTGLVEVAPDGTVQVLEAAAKVRATPLDEWIKRGTAGRITVKRVRGLSEDDARKVIAAAHAYDGRPYDFFFHDDKETIYCSELVHRAYEEGPGMAIGKVQKVRELDIDNAAVRALIESRWRQHPLCANDAAKDFQACYGLILDQTLVTPAAVARDARLDLVYSNFSIAGD